MNSLKEGLKAITTVTKKEITKAAMKEQAKQIGKYVIKNSKEQVQDVKIMSILKIASN